MGSTALFFSIVFLLWDERKKRRRAFSVSACTSLALTICKEGEEACYPFLSHSSLALASFLLTAPTLLQLCSSAGNLVGPRKVQHTQEKSPRMSAPLSSPRLASTAWFPESSAPEDQAGGRTRAQWRSPHASGSAERLRSPAGSEEEGVSSRAGGEVRRPAGRMKWRWIPGKTKALPGPADA